ncbi:MAG: DUF4325 domain-containing protein [Candidatus Parvarchaeota archaeon]|nr:DUF4325 domain-containing protein [Candidatus Parvarchaeota archaeon]MCW1294865.1 DUF4325 domain-containing protein [Candidatus Parvarchaeum tengchongense]MCW1295849.1 DUF4325 domain-containing protein [Candidatus Parvarchaeum tengchongense]MCW1299655.1 DUF4325 domain-containing protein [Candidatus Parvarchaeum tengchongense]MCW1312354.1 DUF4325 domain-containing protein [Candidatus Parvarchaeum tengchongense]
MKGKIINIKRKINVNLAFRQEANDLFNYIENKFRGKVTLDFNGVESVSNAFAKQYVLRKLFSIVEIKEINMPKNVEAMFSIAYERIPNKKSIPSLTWLSKVKPKKYKL